MTNVIQLPKLSHPDFALPNVKPKRPVEIDWDNPLTKGLVGCWLVSDGPKNPQNLASGSVIGNGTSLYGEQRADHWHSAIAVNGNDLLGHEDLPISGSGNDKEVPASTILSICAPESVGSFYGTLGCSRECNSEAGTGAGFSRGLAIYMQGAAPYDVDVMTAYEAVYTGSKRIDSIVDGAKLIITATNAFDAGDGYPNCELIINGQVATLPADDFWRYGAGVSTNTLYDNDRGYWTGNLYCYAVWDREMSLEQLARLNADPYQILKPAIPLTYFVPAAAAAGGNEPLFYHHQRMLSRCS